MIANAIFLHVQRHESSLVQDSLAIDKVNNILEPKSLEITLQEVENIRLYLNKREKNIFNEVFRYSIKVKVRLNEGKPINIQVNVGN